MNDTASEEHASGVRVTGTIPAIPPGMMYHDPVWHYTDGAGLAGIATGGPRKDGDSYGNGCLWATAATTLNDPGELTYGAQRIREWYEQYGAEAPDGDRAHRAIRSALPELESSLLSEPAYDVSASMDGDSLGQWRGYAGPGGYAIHEVLDRRARCSGKHVAGVPQVVEVQALVTSPPNMRARCQSVESGSGPSCAGGAWRLRTASSCSCSSLKTT